MEVEQTNFVTHLIITVFTIIILAELSRAKRASGAPWVRKFGKLSIR